MMIRKFSSHVLIRSIIVLISLHLLSSMGSKWLRYLSLIFPLCLGLLGYLYKDTFYYLPGVISLAIAILVVFPSIFSKVKLPIFNKNHPKHISHGLNVKSLKSIIFNNKTWLIQFTIVAIAIFVFFFTYSSIYLLKPN